MMSAPISSPTAQPHSGRGPFAVLRRAKNVKKAGEMERNALLEDAERMENWCMWLVFAGIALEAALVPAPQFMPIVRLGDFLADAAIAAGVYGEMRFGGVAGTVLKEKLADASALAVLADGRAASASSQASRVMQDLIAANERLTGATERLAEVEMTNGFLEGTVAEANERAVKAELETERLKNRIGPRNLNIEAFSAALRGQPKMPIQLVYLQDEPECHDLVSMLYFFFNQNGWDVARPGFASRGRLSGLRTITDLGGQQTGISMVVAGSLEEHTQEGTPFNAVRVALRRSLNVEMIVSCRHDSVPEGVVRIVVAPRF